MPARLSYAQLLETNMLLREGSDVSYWLCTSRTNQESKLFPVPAYILLSYLNCFYRYPSLLRKIDEAMPAEEIGDRARETATSASNISVGWCLKNFYLLGRQWLIDMGLLRPTDAVDDIVSVLDFWKRFMLAYHRADGHLTNGGFGNRSQILAERQLQVFESDAIPVRPGDPLHTAATSFLATASQYAFLSHCECRLGLRNDGPYRVGSNEMLVRSFVNLAEGDFPWLDGVASGIRYPNLVLPMILKDTHFRIVDDWESFEAHPNYDLANLTAIGLYGSDYLSDGFVPIGMGGAAELTATLNELREAMKQATSDLWKVIANWSRDQMLDAGALVYFASVRDLAHIAGVYHQDDWFSLDERVQRFKPLMNDEYGRDALGELVGLLTLPSQQTHEYAMGRFSDQAAHMLWPIPYSVLVDDDYSATSGPPRSGSSSLPAKSALWTMMRGTLSETELNDLARSFRPRVLQVPYRFLDDAWVKYHAADQRADELYRIAQIGSRTLDGQGAGLRRPDLPSVAG